MQKSAEECERKRDRPKKLAGRLGSSLIPGTRVLKSPKPLAFAINTSETFSSLLEKQEGCAIQMELRSQQCLSERLLRRYWSKLVFSKSEAGRKRPAVESPLVAVRRGNPAFTRSCSMALRCTLAQLRAVCKIVCISTNAETGGRRRGLESTASLRSHQAGGASRF